MYVSSISPLPKTKPKFPFRYIATGNSRSPLTWYINHETNVFSAGPSLLEGRRRHDSATIVDKVTKEKIPMVTGGIDNGGRLDSTELLINGIWQSGTIQCPKIATPVMKGGIALFFSLSH